METVISCPNCGIDMPFDYFCVFEKCNSCLEAGEITNETFGVTIEWLMSILSGVECSHELSRVNKKMITVQIFELALEQLKILPKIIQFIGGDNGSVDFILEGGKTLSVKTNITGGKVCPNKIGQTTRKKFCENHNITGDKIKDYIFNNVEYLVNDEYFPALFSCDYTLWMYSSNAEMMAEIFPRKKYKRLSSFSFTRYVGAIDPNKEWAESNTVKVNNLSIGEFQIHNHRDGVKFRFNFPNLLKILEVDEPPKTKYPFPLNYIGSKKSLLQKIELILKKYSYIGDTFGDLFCGTGIITYIASRLYEIDDTGNKKSLYSRIVSNDLMYYGYVLAKAMLCPPEVEIVIPNQNMKEGFIYDNYTREKLYFSNENAKRIDGIRQGIEKISNEEAKMVAIASLLSCADKVANTASVYGAFLKKLKSSALKSLDFKIDEFSRVAIEHTVYNTYAENIDEKIDVLYIDTPYNNRDYSSNYHILETIAKYDNPEIKGKTGLRMADLKSNFCKKSLAEDSFKKLIEKNSRTRIIVISYNNEGIVPFSNMINILRKNRNVDVYRILYRGFISHKEQKESKVFEFLFVGILDDNPGIVSFYDL
jgi:adenine-specific DNA-methyltransferase